MHPPAPAVAQPELTPADETLPLDDERLRDAGVTVDDLALHWARYAARRPFGAEGMRGADRRAQRMGVPGEALMEQAGFAVSAAARAVLNSVDRPSGGLVLVLCGPGNNGGDGMVAARHLAAHGVRSAVVLAAADERPQTRDAAANWERLAGVTGVERIHAATAHDVAILLNGLERAALIVDALLGTGVRGALREPVRSAVELCVRARTLGVPVLAVDTPTALDLSSGAPSDPVVRADLTVTFHRPKEGLSTRLGRVLAGRVLVAPIGIPLVADGR